MDTIGRRSVLRGLAAAAAATTAAGILPAFGQDRTAIRIGYAISKTGPNAPGAGITTTPNYLLWVDDVTKAGGIKLSKLGKTERRTKALDHVDKAIKQVGLALEFVKNKN